jgi:hypothetical protein
VVADMSREEKILAYIKAKQLLSFEEWYALNETCFKYGMNKNDPKRLYEEYVNEVLGE